MPALIVVLPKSPWDKGRWGRKENQDWYRTILRAGVLLEEDQSARVLLPTAVCMGDGQLESTLYQEVFSRLGVTDVVTIEQGYETTGQIEAAATYATQQQMDLTIITTFLHYPRVRWIMRGISARHDVVWGVPRPTEAVTDIILWVVYPLIDLLGLRSWFVYKSTDIRSRCT